jgi:N-methylhydantoinase B
VRIDGVQCPPWGVAGGQSGRPGRAVVNPGTPRERVLAPLSDGNRLVRGDILLIETGGGGGHGHPFDRPPEAVLADVEGGFVSAASAARDYGVALRGGGLDVAATASLRADRPAAKAFHRGEYADVLG